MKISLRAITYSVFWLAGFSAFLQVTNGFYIQVAAPLLISTLALIFSIFILLHHKKIDIKFSSFIGFYLLPSIISLVILPTSFLINSNLNYTELSFYGRLVNVFFFSILIIGIYSTSADKSILLKGYYWGCVVLLFTGVWQLVSAYSSIPFPFDTRAHLHSTYGQDFTFTQRMTGIAQEPSYFVMFAIDLFALTLILDKGLKQKIVLLLSIFCLLLSLAPSGALTFILAITFSMLFYSIKYLSFKASVRKISFMFFTATFLLIIIPVFIKSDIFSYLYTRVVNLDLNSSPRFYESIMPFIWSAESNIINILFGHGMKSYSLLANSYPGPNGEIMHATSNNIYTDIFWESGIVGLSLLLCLYIYLFLKVLTSKFSRQQIFIAFFVFFDIVFSGFFRADFASFRFFILLYLVYLLAHHDLRKLGGGNV